MAPRAALLVRAARAAAGAARAAAGAAMAAATANKRTAGIE
jgi:hypothetical protein